MTAGLRNYKRHMITKFGGTCVICEAVTLAGRDYAAVDADRKWHAFCAACASSFAMQVQRTLPLVEAAATPLTPDQVATLVLPSDDDIVRSLSGEAEGLAFDTLCTLRGARLHALALSGQQVLATESIRANKYEGNCASCFTPVAAGAGRIEKQGGKWATFHLDGQCSTVKGEAPVVVPAGRYAVPSATGNNDLDFYDVDHGKAGSKWEGYIFVGRIIGGHGTPQRITKREQNAALRAIVAAGVEHSLRLFGQTIGKCGHCGRPLTDADSRAKGIGPVCEAGI